VAEKVLVVDDSRELRTVLAAQLRRQGFEVGLAVDGQDALEKVHTLKPDLILMDVMMPKMDGMAACRALRADPRTRGIPVIMLTALAGEGDIVRGMQAGADDYVVKPFGAKELSDAILKARIRRTGGYADSPNDDTVETEAPNDMLVRRFKETGAVVSKDFAGFQIVDKIGQGGSGTVYHAIEPVNSSPVALKVVSPFISQTPGFVDRFRRSSSISLHLRHPNIVRSYTVGEYEGVHYLTQELMTGPTLDRALADRGPFTERRALSIMLDIARALAYIESEGLIHRDVKPANIFESTAADDAVTAKLADFGLSRATEDLDRTAEGHVLGTPHYISPEQAMGNKQLDTRCDLYSLAATVFHLLTGHPPYGGDTFSAQIMAHITQAIPDPRVHLKSLSPATAALLMRFMSKDPADRAPSVAKAIPLIEAVLAAAPA
jgi:CheY-like chemotaxis protein